MKKAVIFGAGNIGRGFIGQLFSLAGYFVTFIDINPIIVQALKRDHRYPVDIVSNDGSKRTWVENADAISSDDIDAAAQQIAECDILATAVGVNVLQSIAPVLLSGICLRWDKGSQQPLNIIICENLIHADQYLRDILLSKLPQTSRHRFSQQVGLIMASVGRMVPVMTPEQKSENPLLVIVEPFNTLPVDRDAFKGEIPEVLNMIPTSPFDFVIEKKLFMHNLGHAVCAYLGIYSGYQYIFESMSDPWIYLCVQNAMLESTLSLYAKYKDSAIGLPSLVDHIHDLMHRFQNRALQDTNERVGADPSRKLRPNDRLIGAASLAISQGNLPIFTAIGIACSLHNLMQANPATDISAILMPLKINSKGTTLVRFIEKLLQLVESGASVKDLFMEAERARAGQR